MKLEKADGRSGISLGRQGEHLARGIVFDLSGWIADYGDGTAELIYQRPGDARPYPVAAARNGSLLVWSVTSLDTAAATFFGSCGHCELRWYVGSTLVKSRTWRTWVEPAMDIPAEAAPPAPEQGWLEQVLSASAAAEAAAVRAETAQAHAPKVQDGTWWVFDPSAGAYVDSAISAYYRPVRGTDYWTAEDRAAIVNDVLAALPDGTEVSY